VSALAQETRPSFLCACGCGEEVNPKARLVRLLRDRGKTHVAIALEIGVSRHYVSILLSNPPQFIKGHSRKPGPRPIRNCDNCGEPYKQQGPRQLHCRKQECHWLDHERRILAPWNETQERKAERLQQSTRRQRDLRLATDPYVWRSPEEVERDRTEELRAVKREADDELFQLIEAQEKDGYWVNRRWEISLDEPFQSPGKEDEGRFGDRHGLARYASTGSTIDAELDRERLWELVGDMHPDDVARMDDHSLARLQARLAEEGLATPKVTQSERERLREPDKHSGSHIKKSKSRGGKRRRKEQIALMKGHRPSRKQPKRWTREKVKDAW
jgi:hypothetical protein